MLSQQALGSETLAIAVDAHVLVEAVARMIVTVQQVTLE
jgi:hypothetical protein